MFLFIAHLTSDLCLSLFFSIQYNAAVLFFFLPNADALEAALEELVSAGEAFQRRRPSHTDAKWVNTKEGLLYYVGSLVDF